MATSSHRARYDLRRDEVAWTVFDVMTGCCVVTDAGPQAGLTRPDAEALAALLNCKAFNPGRRLLQ